MSSYTHTVVYNIDKAKTMEKEIKIIVSYVTFQYSYSTATRSSIARQFLLSW